MSRTRKPTTAAAASVASLALALSLVTSVSAAAAPVGPRPDAPPRACEATPAVDTGTAAGWLGYLAAHRGDVSFVLDDGRGTRVAHRPHAAAPAASAIKVVHLAAYATAVARGRLDPEQQVRVGDWEAWYLPTDGGAHGAALDALGVPRDDLGRALDPDRTVRLDDVVAAMIRFSDNAAPDYLRARLGDAALYAAASRGGTALDLPTLVGSTAGLLDPSLAVPARLPRIVRGALEWQLARRIAADPALRARLQAAPLPPVDVQIAWAERSWTVRADGLARLHRAISTGAYGPGSDVARRHLEWPPPPPGVLGIGVKGGALPGVLTEGVTVRRADGTTASMALLVRRMPLDAWTTALTSFAHQELLLAAAQDPATAERLRCSLSG